MFHCVTLCYAVLRCEKQSLKNKAFYFFLKMDTKQLFVSYMRGELSAKQEVIYKFIQVMV